MAGEALLQTSVGVLKKILQVLSNDKNSIGQETLTVTTGALGLTPTSGASNALIQVESTNSIDAVRYWQSGASPTSTVGFVQGNGAVIEVTTAEQLRLFKVIKGAGAGATTLNIMYFR